MWRSTNVAAEAEADEGSELKVVEGSAAGWVTPHKLVELREN
jgi:hypothetical protein